MNHSVFMLVDSLESVLESTVEGACNFLGATQWALHNLFVGWINGMIVFRFSLTAS